MCIVYIQPTPFLLFYNVMKKVFIAAILFLLVACSQRDCREGLPVISVNELLKSGETINLSKYASDIEYIPLETNAESVIMANSVKSDGLNFYVSAIGHSNDVARFSADGKYIGRIGKRGRGPGEYTFLEHYGIVRDVKGVGGRNRIFVAGHNKTVIYDGNGAVGEIISESRIDDLECLNDNRYAFLLGHIGENNEVLQKIVVTDSLGRELHEIEAGNTSVTSLDMGGRSIQTRQRNFIYSFGDSLRLVNAAVDTLFAVQENVKKPLLSLCWDNWKGNLPNGNFIFETERFIMIPVSFPTSLFADYFKNIVVPEKSSSAKIVFDKREKRATPLLHDSKYRLMYGFKNDIDDGAPFLPSYSDGKKMYQIVQAAHFKEVANLGNSAKMKAVAAQLTEESNPVLIVVTLK